MLQKWGRRSRYQRPAPSSFCLETKKRGPFGSRSLLLRNHHHVAVGAFYVDDLGCPYTVAAAGANIFNAVAVGVAGPCWLACRVPCTFAARCIAALYAVHANVVPALRQNELTKGFRWLCYAPTDARVITDFQVTGFGGGFEFFVVILPAPAAILYAALHIVDVYALVEFRCNNFENASVKSSCPDI